MPIYTKKTGAIEETEHKITLSGNVRSDTLEQRREVTLCFPQPTGYRIIGRVVILQKVCESTPLFPLLFLWVPKNVKCLFSSWMAHFRKTNTIFSLIHSAWIFFFSFIFLVWLTNWKSIIHMALQWRKYHSKLDSLCSINKQVYLKREGH